MTRGQSVVLYDGDRLLGGGVIHRPLGNVLGLEVPAARGAAG